jgi:transposase
MEKDPITLAEAQLEIRALRAENAALKSKLAEVIAENEVLRSENAELKSKLAEVSSELSKIKEFLGLHSQNSSKPPSSDQKKSNKPKGSSGQGHGGQKGHQGHYRKVWPEEDLTEQIICPPVSECPCGGQVDIRSGRIRHQVFELPEIQPEVREYQILSGVCCGCGQTHRGQLPAGVPTGMVGPRLMAWMGLLASYLHLSKAKIQFLIQELLGVSLSTATISAQEETLSEALKPICEEALAAIQSAEYLHLDETGFRQGNTDGQNPTNKKAWIWTAVSAHITVFLIQLGRGKKQAQQLISDDFSGVVASDRWCSYAWIPIHRRSFCWAHLLREFRRLAERENEAQWIAEDLITATQDVFRWHQAWQHGELSEIEYQNRIQLLRADVQTHLQHGAVFVKHSDPILAQSGAFFQRLLKEEVALWVHADSKNIEPSNNKAERALRPLVVWRKVCYCTQSLRGSEFLQRVFTVIATCQQQQRNTLHFLTQTIQAHLKLGTAPSLIPICP